MEDDPAKMEPLQAYRYGYARAEWILERRYEESLRAERMRTEEMCQRANRLAEEIAKGYMLQPPPILYVKQLICPKCGAQDPVEILKPQKVVY